MKGKISIFCLLIVFVNIVHSQNNLYKAVYSGDIDYIKRYYLNNSSPNAHFEFSNSDLRILRNTIYAIHGYRFRSRDLQEHFQKFAWYSGEKENVENELTENEKIMIRIIAATEAANQPVRKDLVGYWQAPAPPGSSGDTLGFIGVYLHENGTMEIPGWYNYGEWALEGDIFRSRLRKNNSYNPLERFEEKKIRINFVEYIWRTI
jgi:hypothetical protein